ncbi:SRPBCC family protein [Nocardia spumae]|uniref:SRPBCC family protein n=1 Tax=Nocardia spumae TaxID=2887190 RepID=UPI001D14B6C8|nr:SRPBCC family protein [Nocardia spumae]
MTQIATAHAVSTAAPADFFAVWADMAAWPEWNTDTEWVRLDGPFVEGATGTLKPKGGPKVPFVVERLTDEEFVDVSRLLGARLVFAHRVVETEAGCEVSVTITMTGPLRRLWSALMGRGLAGSVQRDLDALVTTAQARRVAQHGRG